MFAARRIEPAIEFAVAATLGLSEYPDTKILEFAAVNRWLIVSHDVNTMRGHAEVRVQDGLDMAGLFLAPQKYPSRVIAENLVLIWSASQLEEWQGRVVYLPL